MWNSLTVAALLRGNRNVKWYSYHAHTSFTVSGGSRNATVHDLKPYNTQTPTKYLYGRKYAAYNKQFYATFPWHFPDFSKIPDISLKGVKFRDISRFRDRPKVVFLLTAVTESGTMSEESVLAVTETKPKFIAHLRP